MACSLTVNNLPCMMVTEEISSLLLLLGRDPTVINRVIWRAGASKYSEVTVMMTKDNVAALKSLNQANPISVVVDSGEAAGPVVLTFMYLLDYQPLHLRGTADGLYLVKIVDARYFWRYLTFTGVGYNLTSPNNHTYIMDATSSDSNGGARPLTDMLNDLLVSLGIAGATTITSGDITGLGGTAYDLEQVCDRDYPGEMLDRWCARCGLVFTALWTFTAGKLYAISTPSTLNTDAGKILNTSSSFYASIVGGGTLYSANNADGLQWLNTNMPAQVVSLFPKFPGDPANYQSTAANSLHPIDAGRWFAKSSVVGKPAGATGRASSTVTIECPTWYCPSLAANVTAINAAADGVAAAFYRRFLVDKVDAVLRGIQNIGNWPGEVHWWYSPAGPFTKILTPPEWTGFGGTWDAVKGENGPRIVGLNGIQATTSMDGTITVADTKPVRFWALITAYTPVAANLWKYTFREVIPGTFANAPGGGGYTSGINYTGTFPTDFAYNLWERGNVANSGSSDNYVMGVQINSASTTTNIPATFNVIPVGGGAGGAFVRQTLVEMWAVGDASGNPKFFFFYPNAIDGPCS